MKHWRFLGSVCVALAPLLLFSVPGQTEQPDSKLPVVGVLKQPEFDVGCWLQFRNASKDEYIFGSTPDKVSMNLDGKDTVLTSLTTDVADDTQRYKAGDVQITVRFGPGKPTEAGSAYSHATIILSRNGKTKVITAKGNCGC